jgi:hypothetical protein
VAPEPPEVTETGRRRVRLGDGELLVRPIEAADVAGLAALYEALDPDDRYRRFFSAYRPPPTFFERMTMMGNRGGVGLVAAYLPVSGGASRIVGDAEYELLPNGDGELAITVAAGWRGWLGPYLLDALVDAARARGVPNLEADVLVTNGPMLALARARGCVTMDHEDWSVVRVLIGTAARTPTWPPRDQQPRVLLEGSAGRWRAEEAVRRAGLSVIACPGPAGPRVRCPALSGRPCPLAAGADVIVLRRAPDTAISYRLLTAHSTLHPGVRVCLETDPALAGPWPGVTARLPRGEQEVVTLLRDLAALDTPPSAPSTVDPDHAGAE